MAEIALVYALFTLSWDLFCGATGEVSFGHTFLIGTAAYATALGQTRLGLNPFLSMLAGTLAGTLAGLLMGVLTLRQTGAVFAMVTMALQLTFHRTLFVGSRFFGGEEGVSIPRALFDEMRTEYRFIALLAILSLLFALGFRKSRLGRQLRASGGDTRVGLASGVPVPQVRLIGAALSGFFASLGGSLVALQNRLANHEMASDSLAALIFLLAVVGGAGTLVGPWAAGLLYVAVIRESLVGLGSAEPLVVSGAILVLVWIMPDGPAAVLSKIGGKRSLRGSRAVQR